MNEGAFELPEQGAVDRTTHVIESGAGEHTLTLVVCRAPLPGGKSLRQAAQARVLDELTRLSGYGVTAERETSWDGMPTLEYTSRWRHEGKVIHQQQAHLAPHGRWIYFALSAQATARTAADAWFDRIRDTIRLRNQD